MCKTAILGGRHLEFEYRINGKYELKIFSRLRNRMFRKKIVYNFLNTH